MKRLAITLAAAIFAQAPLAAPTWAQVKADDSYIYGADPGWAKFREIAEAAVIAQLIDPESARISWSSGHTKGVFKPLLQRRVHGYVACGQVNARNRMGGYTGATAFIAVVDHGRALFIELDLRPGGMYGEMCRKQIADGILPPLPAATTPVATAEAGTSPPAAIASPAGLSVRAMPEGAYIAAVTPGSPAAAVGLAPGMVITSVNAIPLAGMGEAMTKVVAAAQAGAALTLVGGKTITLGAVR